MTQVWLNGALVDEADAAISPHDRGLLLGDGVFVYFDMFAAEVGLTAHALGLEDDGAGLDAAGTAFAAVAVHGGVFVDKVGGDIDLLGHTDVAIADLREIGQALAVGVAEAAAAVDADADGRVFALGEATVDFAGTFQVEHRNPILRGRIAKMAL